MKRLLKPLFWTSLSLSLLFAAWFVLHGTLHFHTDIARDFLLVEDMIVSKKPALIGPRSGGIPGVFHGPAWLYLNLPIFLLSGGNPVATAWFWVLLIGVSIYFVYSVARKWGNEKEALGATALYAFAIASSASNLINPFGAVLLSPLFFYFFVKYKETKKTTDLLICLFILGMIIQFQMAWGVPILILSLPLLLYLIIKFRRYSHLFAFGILSVPLSTFLLFDLRHQFLQLKSVISYIFGVHPDKPHVVFTSLLASRAFEMTRSMGAYFSQGNTTLSYFITIVFVVLSILYFRLTIKKRSPIPFYFLYFFCGFWVITLLFKGTMWSYYFWPFLPLFCIVSAYCIGAVFKKQSTSIFIFLFLLTSGITLYNLSKQTDKVFTENSGYWHFYKKQATDIYKDAGGEFGWYVYSADQYGYSSKYAMHYMQKQYPIIKMAEFQKKPITYLSIFPSTNRFTNESWWRKDQIKIVKKPVKVLQYIGGSYTEKYILSTSEQMIPSDPNLIQNLLFR